MQLCGAISNVAVSHKWSKGVRSSSLVSVVQCGYKTAIRRSLQNESHDTCENVMMSVSCHQSSSQLPIQPPRQRSCFISRPPMTCLGRHAMFSDERSCLCHKVCSNVIFCIHVRLTCSQSIFHCSLNHCLGHIKRTQQIELKSQLPWHGKNGTKETADYFWTAHKLLAGSNTR